MPRNDPIKDGFSKPRDITSSELAEVIRFDTSTNSYVVITRGVGGDSSRPGGRQLNNIPRKVENPYTVTPLAPGTLVVINWDLGFPFIDGVLPIEYPTDTIQGTTAKQPTIGLGGNTLTDSGDQSTATKAGDYRTPTMPSDILPDDWLQTSPEGNRIGVLRDGYCMIDGGPHTKAKVETFGTKDLVRVTCEDLEVITGFGTIEFYNTEGRCGVQIRGGSDQINQTGGDEEQWTFKLDVGDTGDFFNLEVCSADGKTKAKLYISTDGRVEIISTSGLSLANGGDSPFYIESAADLLTKVAGSLRETVSGASNYIYEGNRTTKVSSRDYLTINADSVRNINANEIINIGDNQTVLISGGTAINAKPSNTAVSIDILNGSYFMELGNTLKGASPAAKASYTIAVNNGDVFLGENPDMLSIPAMSATVNLNTSKPRTIALGGTTGPSKNMAIYNAVMFQPLMQILTQMITMFDTHTQPPYSPPVVPMSTVITPMLVQMMSQRVLIGG